MLVSGGKILAIDRVYHDNTLSGDGVNKPLGVDPSQLGNNVIVSAGMNTTVDAYTGENNVITYVINAKTSGAATTEVRGDEQTGIKSEWIENGNYWLISYIGKQGNIYSAGPNIGIYQENGQWKISASQPDIDALSALIAKTYLSATTFDAYSADIVKQFAATSAWANKTFQPKGEYLSASEHFLSANALDTLSGKWNEVSAKADTTAVNKQFENTSAWANSTFQPKGEYLSASEKFLSANALDELSGTWNEVSAKAYTSAVDKQFENTSAWANATFQPIGEYLSASEKFLSANALDSVSGKWNEVSAKIDTSAVEKEFEKTSAWANATFQPIGEYLSASEKFLSANALDELSGAWNEVSAKQNKLTNAQLSAISSVSSLYNTEVVAGKNVSIGSQTANNTVTYTISADDVIISGNNGISAAFDTTAKQWNIGLSAANSYACYVASMTGNGTTYSVDEYEQVYNAGSEITLGTGTIDIAGQGLWHITVNATIENNANALDDSYYNTTLSFGTNTATIQFDNSYQHAETLNLDFDKLISDDTTYSNAPIITDAPENVSVHITNISIHKVATGITYMEGSTTYVGGKAIKIGDNNDINFVPGSGLQAGYNGADVKLGNALGFDTNSAIEVLPGSGLFIDNKKKLSLRLGKGLAFSGDGDVIALETNSDVNAVVETVETLKKELDGKLTTNMNVSDAKEVIHPLPEGTNIAAATLFTVPLQHNLTSSTEISFFTTQRISQSDIYPIIFGIYEYNFDYIETANDPAHNNIRSRSQTKWVADTGPIWNDTTDIKGHSMALASDVGKFTFKLKNVASAESKVVSGLDGTEYVNEFGPSMRSDRAYYLVLFAQNRGALDAGLLGDGGYSTSVNDTDPQLTFKLLNGVNGNAYFYPDDSSAAMTTNWYSQQHTASANISLSGIPYWSSAYRRTDAVQQLGRPFVMIRNPRI